MHELPRIMTAEVLLALEPEELGARLLFLLRKRHFQQDQFAPGQLNAELWPSSTVPGQQTPYPRDRQEAIDLALREAWAWLQAQGLIVPAGDPSGRHGWLCLSRRARRFESEAEFARYAVARMLPKDALHPRIADTVWMAFMRSEFDVAVLQAMKAVEVAVREAAGLPAKDIGTALMRKAFDPEAGPLTDTTAEKAEREALSALFAGAIGCYKNPQSHRDVQLTDAAEAVEIVIMANHLLRIVDNRGKARQ
jgi:uncharacterized protein (TIGR02391 family)